MSDPYLVGTQVTPLTALPNLGQAEDGDLFPIYRAGQETPLQAATFPPIGGGGGAVDPPWTCMEITTNNATPYEINAAGVTPTHLSYCITSDGSGMLQYVDVTALVAPLPTEQGLRLIFYFETRTNVSDVIGITVGGSGFLPVYSQNGVIESAYQNTNTIGGRMTQAGQLISLFWDGNAWDIDPYYTSFNDSTIWNVENVALQPITVDAAGDNNPPAGTMIIKGGDTRYGANGISDGTLILQAGSILGSATGYAAGVLLAGGDGGTEFSNDSGNVTIRGGNTTTASASAGNVNINGGSNASGAGGGVTITGGACGTTGGGGGINIAGGGGALSSDPSLPGSIQISPGQFSDSTWSWIIVNQLPTSDPKVAGALFTLGALAANTPRALWVSGG